MRTTLHTSRIMGLLLALTGMALAMAGNAFAANTAANHIIRNTVTVNYNDAGGNPQAAITDSVDITVLLVAKAPTLSAPADGITDSATPEDYIYTLTATANGPDTYDLAVGTITESAGITNGTSTATFLQGGVAIPSNQLTLGASTVAVAGSIADSGNTAITVPNDNADDGMVNGIAAGDFVVINNQLFEVFSVDDSNWGTPNGMSTITVIGNGTTTAIAVTDQIGEQQTFTLRVTPGSVTSTSDETIDVTISVDGGPPTGPPNDTTRTTVQVAALTVSKEVSTNGGSTFANSANAAPGATLTYRITVHNSGTANATSVIITDPLVPFTVYTDGSAKASSTNDDTYAAAPTSLTDLNAADDGYDFNVTTGNEATYNVGTIPAGEYRLLFFQVTVQ